MPNLNEIKELKTYLVDTYHANRVTQQELDDTYRDDTFSIPFLPDKITRVKTGKGYRMVSAPAEHIITSNPQVFREPKGKATEAASRLAAELNRWARTLLRQVPQPYKEYVKKLLGKGEGWTYWYHNNNFDPSNPNSLPFCLVVPDPTVVFVDPTAGEENGVPNRVIVSYSRVASNIKQNYPQWVWNNQKGRKWNEYVPFFMYWDNEHRYFDADGDALLMDPKGQPYGGNGVQPNIYGFVPFVHSYSGFGEGSPDGDPASLAVGRLTKIHDLIAEYTAIRSVIDYLTYTFATPPLDLFYDPERWVPPPDWASTYDRSPMAINTVPITQGGALKKGVDMLPDAQLFTYLFNIDRQINEEDPLGQTGQVLGTSGRQQDMAMESSLRRYETIVENTAHTFATGFGLVMKMIEKIPDIKPDSIKEGDIGKSYDCRIELKAEDPIEKDRLATLGSRLYSQGQIDLETNLIKYQGYTEEEANQIITNILVELVTFKSPEVAKVLGMKAAEKAGLADEIQQAMEDAKTNQKQYEAMMKSPPPSQQTRNVGEVGTDIGREMVDQALTSMGSRTPPRNYTRNEE